MRTTKSCWPWIDLAGAQQGMRIGMTPITHPTGGFIAGDPQTLCSLSTEHQQVDVVRIVTQATRSNALSQIDDTAKPWLLLTPLQKVSFTFLGFSSEHPT